MNELTVKMPTLTMAQMAERENCAARKSWDGSSRSRDTAPSFSTPTLAVLKSLSDKPMTTREIAEIVGDDAGLVYSRLGTLARRGLVRKVSGGEVVRWVKVVE